MRFIAEPHQVEVMGLGARRIDETVVLRIVGASVRMTAAPKATADAVHQVECTPEEARQLIEAVMVALRALGYEVVESHGKRRG